MSYKSLQLSPRTSTSRTSMRVAIHGPWSSPPGKSPDIQFLQTWLEYDSDLDEGVVQRRFNWGALAGLTLAVGFSASFWVGVGLIVARIWR